MWLGTSQQLDKIAIREVPLLSTHVDMLNVKKTFLGSTPER